MTTTLHRTARRFLPRGQTLPDDAWRLRHRMLMGVLWLHAAAIPIYALTRGVGPLHALADGAPMALLALVAAAARRRRHRQLAASVGLLTASAMLVHVTGGVTESHFHFFVVVVALTIYEDWQPFLTAVAFVLIHHGLAGAIDGASVFGHTGGDSNPWRWAAIHALFIAAAGIAAVAAWRLNEEVRDRLNEAEERYRTLVEGVPAITYVAEPGPEGRWHYVSPQLRNMLGYSPEEWMANPSLWAACVHPDDRAKALEAEQSSLADGSLAVEYRLVARDGSVRWVRDDAVVRTKDGAEVMDGILTDVTERKQLEERLRDLATRDQMTRLLNRHSFEEELELQVSLTQLEGTPGALLLLDLDRFKTVNDTLGHHAGDELLRLVARALQGRLRGDDVLARLGGDEFAVFLARTDAPAAARVAKGLVERVRLERTELGGRMVATTISVGVAPLLPGDPVNATRLLMEADMAMYEAKYAGGDGYRVYAALSDSAPAPV